MSTEPTDRMSPSPYGSASGWPPPRYPPVEARAGEVEEPPPRRRRGRWLAVTVAVVAAVGAVSYVAASRGGGSSAASEPTVTTAPVSTTTAAARTERPGTTTATATTHAVPAPAGTPKPAAPAPVPTPTVTVTGFVPARSWAWDEQKNVSRYEVTFYRDGAVVLRARSTAPRFVLPRGFRFRAGRYRWTVRPYPTTATSPTFVDSSFVLTAQTAAAGNG